MDILEIKTKLAKKSTLLYVDDSETIISSEKSCLGKVNCKIEGEKLPIDNDGNKMLPLATFFLEGLSGVPHSVKDYQCCSIFISENILAHYKTKYEGYYEIRMYKKTDNLVSCDWQSEVFKGFPLKIKEVDNDYPVWDGGGIPLEIEDEIIRLNDEEGIDYFDDIYESDGETHKIGGYPHYIQSGKWDKENYEFIFQINSDKKINLNIADGGSFYLFYSKKLQKWEFQCDFY